MSSSVPYVDPCSPWTVFKYILVLGDFISVKMHVDAELLHVGVQHDQICVWARVDKNRPLTLRQFRVAGTGHPDARGNHVGSVMLQRGGLVFHVFDLGEVYDEAD